jgi:hypothetical protein
VIVCVSYYFHNNKRQFLKLHLQARVFNGGVFSVRYEVDL